MNAEPTTLVDLVRSASPLVTPILQGSALCLLIALILFVIKKDKRPFCTWLIGQNIKFNLIASAILFLSEIFKAYRRAASGGMAPGAPDSDFAAWCLHCHNLSDAIRAPLFILQLTLVLFAVKFILSFVGEYKKSGQNHRFHSIADRSE